MATKAAAHSLHHPQDGERIWKVKFLMNFDTLVGKARGVHMSKAEEGI